MKTTVNIPNNLFHEAKRLAAQQKTTLRSLLEEGLRRIIRERTETGNFRLEHASFRGKGLQPGVQAARWEQVRDLAYEGRGG